MHSLCGKAMREKKALIPDPLWKGSCSFTILDSRLGYGLWHPWEDLWELSPSLRP